MAKKGTRIIAGLLALLIMAAPLRAYAAGWVDYGLPASGTGSLRLTVSYEEDIDGKRVSEKLSGISFDVYRVWDLKSDGSIVVLEPFTDMITAEELQDEDGDYSSLSGSTPPESVRKQAKDLAKRAEETNLEFLFTTEPTDENGRIQADDLSFGGYLFVPCAESEEATKIEVAADGTRILYTVSCMLATIPMRTGEGITDYTADVEAAAKLSVVKETVPPETTPPETTPEETTPPETTPPETTPEETTPPETTVPPTTPPPTTVPPTTVPPPKTGDHLNLTPWYGLAAAALLGVIGLTAGMKKRSSGK